MYTAHCDLTIKTTSTEELEKFVNALRRDYGDLKITELPDDVDIDFCLSVKKETLDELLDEE